MDNGVARKRHHSASSIPSVRITKGGFIVFNTEAFHLLGNPAAVLIAHDPEKQAVGFKLAHRTDERAYKVHSNRSAYTISVKCFLDYLKIDYSQTYKFVCEMDGDYLAFRFALT